MTTTTTTTPSTTTIITGITTAGEADRWDTLTTVPLMGNVVVPDHILRAMVEEAIATEGKAGTAVMAGRVILFRRHGRDGLPKDLPAPTVSKVRAIAAAVALWDDAKGRNTLTADSPEFAAIRYAAEGQRGASLAVLQEARKTAEASGTARAAFKRAAKKGPKALAPAAAAAPRVTTSVQVNAVSTVLDAVRALGDALEAATLTEKEATTVRKAIDALTVQAG